MKRLLLLFVPLVLFFGCEDANEQDAELNEQGLETVCISGPEEIYALSEFVLECICNPEISSMTHWRYEGPDTAIFSSANHITSVTVGGYGAYIFTYWNGDFQICEGGSISIISSP